MGRVDALVEGDEIVATTEDGTLTTDTVSLLSIRQPEVNAQFLVLATSSNATLTLPVVDGLVTAFDSIDKVRLAQFGLAPLIAACKKSGTCAKFRELFLAGDGKYVAMAESYRR